jgi:5-methylcytosine-specific restriction endonuclease McrA
MPVFRSRRARRSWIQAVRVELLSINPCCWYCGCDLPLAKWATLDHLVPRSRGGADEPENVLLACKRCNRRKGARLIDEGLTVQLRRGCGLFAVHDAICRGMVPVDRLKVEPIGVE